LRAHGVRQISRQTIRILRDLEDARVGGKQRKQRCSVAIVQRLHVGANDCLRIDVRGGDARKVHADGLGRLAGRHRFPILHVVLGVDVTPRGRMEVMRMRVEVVGVAQYEAQHLGVAGLVDVVQLVAHVAVMIGAQLRADQVEHCRSQLFAVLPLLVQQRRAEADRPEDVDHRFVVRQGRVPLAHQAAHACERDLCIGVRSSGGQHCQGGQ